MSRSAGFCFLFSLSYNRPTIKKPWHWKIDIAANRFGTLKQVYNGIFHAEATWIMPSLVGLSGPKTLHNHDEKSQVWRGCEIVCELTIPTSRDSLLLFLPAVDEIHDSDPEIWDLCESHKLHKNNIHQQRQTRYHPNERNFLARKTLMKKHLSLRTLTTTYHLMLHWILSLAGFCSVEKTFWISRKLTAYNPAALAENTRPIFAIYPILLKKQSKRKQTKESVGKARRKHMAELSNKDSDSWH